MGLVLSRLKSGIRRRGVSVRDCGLRRGFVLGFCKEDEDEKSESGVVYSIIYPILYAAVNCSRIHRNNRG